jgi:hypothetical protein
VVEVAQIAAEPDERLVRRFLFRGCITHVQVILDGTRAIV